MATAIRIPSVSVTPQERSQIIQQRVLQYNTVEALFLALREGRGDIVERIAESGEIDFSTVARRDLGEDDEEEEDLQQPTTTPLHYTLLNRMFDLTVLLVRLGTDVNRRWRDGLAPLHLAVISGCAQSVAFLVGSGVDPNVVVEDGTERTCLHLAAEMGNRSMTECLLRHGVEKSRLDAGGRTAMQVWNRKAGERGASLSPTRSTMMGTACSSGGGSPSSSSSLLQNGRPLSTKSGQTSLPSQVEKKKNLPNAHRSPSLKSTESRSKLLHLLELMPPPSQWTEAETLFGWFKEFSTFRVHPEVQKKETRLCSFHGRGGIETKTGSPLGLSEEDFNAENKEEEEDTTDWSHPSFVFRRHHSSSSSVGRTRSAVSSSSLATRSSSHHPRRGQQQHCVETRRHKLEDDVRLGQMDFLRYCVDAHEVDCVVKVYVEHRLGGVELASGMVQDPAGLLPQQRRRHEYESSACTSATNAVVTFSDFSHLWLSILSRS